MDEYKELFKEILKEWYDPIFTNYDFAKFISVGFEINNKRDNSNIYPDKVNVFRMFSELNPENVRVVLVGQDPYPSKDEAIGIAFAVPEHIKTPKSLSFLFREIDREYGSHTTTNTLQSWIDQGVFLQNISLTVKEHAPKSHTDLWREFTQAWIKSLSSQNDIVWVMFGNEAQKFSQYITNTTHNVINVQHPSAENYGGQGVKDSKIFTQVNEILKNKNLKEIVW